MFKSLYDAFYDELAYCVAIGAINTSEARFDAFCVGGTSLQNSNKENEHQRTDKNLFLLVSQNKAFNLYILSQYLIEVNKILIKLLSIVFFCYLKLILEHNVTKLGHQED